MTQNGTVAICNCPLLNGRGNCRSRAKFETRDADGSNPKVTCKRHLSIVIKQYRNAVCVKVYSMGRNGTLTEYPNPIAQLAREYEARGRAHLFGNANGFRTTTTPPPPPPVSTTTPPPPSPVSTTTPLQRFRQLVDRNPAMLSDPVIMNLYNRFVNNNAPMPPPPTVKAVMNKQSVISEENSTCCICYEEMTPNNAGSLPSCKHVFHMKCIDKWCNSNRHHQCPMCRTKINVVVST